MIMKPLIHLSLALGCALPTMVHAQFPEIAQHPGSIQELTTLGSGIRFIDWPVWGITAAGSRTIYELDLSIHRVLNYPAPPSGMQWNSMSYVTEELFDTDPSTIEFVMVAGTAGPNPPGNSGTYVFREDGTQLFSQYPGNFVVSGGLSNSYPIFAVEGQSYMVVHTTSVYGPPTRIYALPGTLPCMDCYGSPTTSGIGLGGADVADPFSGMALQPNPAQDEVMVRFTANGPRVDAIEVTDASGRTVLRQPTLDATGITLRTGQLASGAYTVIATGNGRRIGSLPLVIAR